MAEFITTVIEFTIKNNSPCYLSNIPWEDKPQQICLK